MFLKQKRQTNASFCGSRARLVGKEKKTLQQHFNKRQC